MSLSALLFSALLFWSTPTHAQSEDEQRINMLDIKMELVDTKMELLNSKIRLMEEKPAILEMKFQELEDNMELLNFSPGDFNEKFYELDSLLVIQHALLDEQNDFNRQVLEATKHYSSDPENDNLIESFMTKTDKYIMSMLPVKLFEGTMEISLERVLNSGNSLELSAMATYAANAGLAKYYLSNQRLEYFNTAMAQYIPYNSENITGFGGSFAWRNYLLARTIPHYSAPGGPYVAPVGMFRRLTLSGFDHIYNEEEDIMEVVEVTQHLNVFSGGIQAGWQFVLWKVVTADVYIGGIIRLSKYDGTSEFTKYKRLQNIDFSGVMPTAGIKIGIVK